jgi:aspartyl protease family protein
MFGRFAVFTLVIAFAIGMLMPSHKPVQVVAVERDSPIGLKEMVIQRQENGHFYVDGLVNGTSVHFLVDTGASSVALTSEDANRVGLQFSPNEFQQVGYGASGPVMGKQVTLDSVALGRNEVSAVRAVILADSGGLNTSLLGQSYLERVSSVQISGDEMVIR